MAVTIEESAAQAGGGSEPGNPPRCDDYLHLLTRDVMATFESRLNFLLLFGQSEHKVRAATYAEGILTLKHLAGKSHWSALEKLEYCEIDSHLFRAEKAYIEEQDSLFHDVVSSPSMMRGEMMSYYGDRQRSVARNNAAHPFSTAVASEKYWDANDYPFYGLLNYPSPRGEDPVVNKSLLDALAELEGLAESGDLPEVLSKAKTCFVMQLRFLKHVLTLPPDDAKDGAGSWAAVVKKGPGQVKANLCVWQDRSGLTMRM